MSEYILMDLLQAARRLADAAEAYRQILIDVDPKGEAALADALAEFRRDDERNQA
jgi:hypothetical protein